MSKAKHWSAQQEARISAFLGKARRASIVLMVAVLAVIGVGVGLAESASTSLPPLAGGEERDSVMQRTRSTRRGSTGPKSVRRVSRVPRPRPAPLVRPRPAPVLQRPLTLGRHQLPSFRLTTQAPLTGVPPASVVATPTKCSLTTPGSATLSFS